MTIWVNRKKGFTLKMNWSTFPFMDSKTKFQDNHVLKECTIYVCMYCMYYIYKGRHPARQTIMLLDDSWEKGIDLSMELCSSTRRKKTIPQLEGSLIPIHIVYPLCIIIIRIIKGTS
jgi:hypothetical protein